HGYPPHDRRIDLGSPRYSPTFSSTHTATTDAYTLSLHDALPISCRAVRCDRFDRWPSIASSRLSSAVSPSGKNSRNTTRSENPRSEEHTSELQSRRDLVCRLLLEKKNITRTTMHTGSVVAMNPSQ